MSPPVALDEGLRVLCSLLALWGQEGPGLLTLTEWLMGDEESKPGASAGGPSSPDDEEEEEEDEEDEELLFEKGELNLWAEPVQWARLLHGHLITLTTTAPAALSPTSMGPYRDRVHVLRARAQAHTLDSSRVLDGLPGPLPQFSCRAEHGRLVVWRQRATLALDVLDRLV
ncbi:hypothetical protein CRUP_007007 [Coryphaenoides rupestris]|nr:hypothetical protein CRUP_007007 [Coryphaenoides rupestris]